MLKEIRPVGGPGKFPRPRRNHPHTSLRHETVTFFEALPSMPSRAEAERCVRYSSSGLVRSGPVLLDVAARGIHFYASRIPALDVGALADLARAGLLWPVSVRRDVAIQNPWPPRGPLSRAREKCGRR